MINNKKNYYILLTILLLLIIVWISIYFFQINGKNNEGNNLKQIIDNKLNSWSSLYDTNKSFSIDWFSWKVISTDLQRSK